MKSKLIATIILVAVIFLLPGSAAAQDHATLRNHAASAPGSVAEHTQQGPTATPHPPSTAEKYFSDVELINQDGQKLRFYSDVLKDKVVIVSSFFTTCTSVCPPMNRNLEKIQEALGERLGKDAFIVSISVDPETDTPLRLKEYARRFHARPGWIFLTGKKENVDWALYKIGQYVEKKDDHSTIVIIGNEPKGLWKKALGMAKPDELMKVVEDVIKNQ